METNKISNEAGSDLKNEKKTFLSRLQSSEFQNPKIPKMILGLAISIAIFFLALKAPNDPDLFWHLKTGELIWNYKTIPQIDWYSYTMSDFRWIDHEWLTEVIMFKIKETFGWLGLAMFFASITAFVFAWLVPRISRSVKGAKAPFYVSMLMALLGTVVANISIGIRPQTLSFLGIALVFFILKEHQINTSMGKRSRIICLLPFLFLFWANMHGTFIIGLGILMIYLLLDKNLQSAARSNPGGEWLKDYQPLTAPAWKNLAYATTFSALATLINPYGAGIYQEIYRTFTDTYATNIIMEWLSPNFHTTTGLLFGFYLIFIFLILAIVKKIDMLSFALLPLFLFLSFQAGRNVPFFVLISLPFLIKSLNGFEKVFASVMQKKFVVIGLAAILIIYPPYVSETKNIFKTYFNEEELAKYGNFPKKAIEFLETYPAAKQKNIMNDYGWGGYLIRNVKCQMSNVKNEQIKCTPKVFIDGRMAHWKLKDRHILKDYADMGTLEDNRKELIEKYKIKIIFLDKNNYLSRALSFDQEWKKIYSDDVARIYEKVE